MNASTGMNASEEHEDEKASSVNPHDVHFAAAAAAAAAAMQQPTQLCFSSAQQASVSYLTNATQVLRVLDNTQSDWNLLSIKNRTATRQATPRALPFVGPDYAQLKHVCTHGVETADIEPNEIKMTNNAMLLQQTMEQACRPFYSTIRSVAFAALAGRASKYDTVTAESTQGDVIGWDATRGLHSPSQQSHTATVYPTVKVSDSLLQRLKQTWSRCMYPHADVIEIKPVQVVTHLGNKQFSVGSTHVDPLTNSSPTNSSTVVGGIALRLSCDITDATVEHVQNPWSEPSARFSQPNLVWSDHDGGCCVWQTTHSEPTRLQQTIHDSYERHPIFICAVHRTCTIEKWNQLRRDAHAQVERSLLQLCRQMSSTIDNNDSMCSIGFKVTPSDSMDPQSLTGFDRWLYQTLSTWKPITLQLVPIATLTYVFAEQETERVKQCQLDERESQAIACLARDCDMQCAIQQLNQPKAVTPTLPWKDNLIRAKRLSFPIVSYDSNVQLDVSIQSRTNRDDDMDDRFSEERIRIQSWTHGRVLLLQCQLSSQQSQTSEVSVLRSTTETPDTLMTSHSETNEARMTNHSETNETRMINHSEMNETRMASHSETNEAHTATAVLNKKRKTHDDRVESKESKEVLFVPFVLYRSSLVATVWIRWQGNEQALERLDKWQKKRTDPGDDNLDMQDKCTRREVQVLQKRGTIDSTWEHNLHDVELKLPDDLEQMDDDAVCVAILNKTFVAQTDSKHM